MPPVLDSALIREHVAAALAEDIGAGDATTEALVQPSAQGQAKLVARENLTLAGMPLAVEAFCQLDPRAQCQIHVQEGQTASPGLAVATVTANLRALLSAERTALNYLQRLSGIASQTAKYVAAINGANTQILDTRKTTPGWRALEKYAVKCGGGTNHRHGLDDMVMIKDNHLASFEGSIVEAVAKARRQYPLLKIEVEADTLAQAEQAAEAGADFILLDNMELDQLTEAVRIIEGRSQTEASGGITLKNISAIAQTGVDAISIGALTHSAVAVDIAMDIVE